MTEPSGPFPGVTRAALARKYQSLAALRARRDAGGPGATKGELRALAAEFPGCLRELDTLGAAELARRATVCAEVAGASGVEAADPEAAERQAEPEAEPGAEPWMAWIAAYHALMGQALAARARRTPELTPAVSDDAFMSATLAPPGGRINVVVLRELARRFGVPAATIAETLFPVRRPSPYRL